MARWIRKVKQDLTNFRISIPANLVAELGWESCRYVVIERLGERQLIIGRMPGDDKRERNCPENIIDTDRPSDAA